VLWIPGQPHEHLGAVRADPESGSAPSAAALHRKSALLIRAGTLRQGCQIFVHKMYQMVVKYTNIFHYKALQNGVKFLGLECRNIHIIFLNSMRIFAQWLIVCLLAVA
jgi:hypothetical protein